MRKILTALFLLFLLPSYSRAQSVTIIWDDLSTNEDGFRCERNVSGGSFSQVCDVGPNITTWTNTGLTLGVAYCYKLRAWNSAGNSAYSNTACKTLTAEAPNATITLTSTTVPEIAPTGLVLAMSMNAGTGATATDTSGQNNHGTISGAKWTTSGKYGGALSFDGVNDMVTVPDANSLDLTTGITLSAWVFPTATSGVRDIIIKEGSNVDIYNLYARNGAGRPESNVFVGGTNRVAEGTTLAVNVWAHIAGTYNGSTLRLFVNGVQVASTAITGAIATSTGSLRIGGNSLWGEFLQGRIDEVRIYNRELTTAEIVSDRDTPIP